MQETASSPRLRRKRIGAAPLDMAGVFAGLDLSELQ
jgi:hypothetical protein